MILPKFCKLYTEVSNATGYRDTGDFWRSAYESDTFQTDLEHLLEELKPLYSELHTYVRSKLRSLYGAEKFPSDGHIPAHILGRNTFLQTTLKQYHIFWLSENELVFTHF